MTFSISELSEEKQAFNALNSKTKIKFYLPIKNKNNMQQNVIAIKKLSFFFLVRLIK
jgi:hypothetical protein